MVRSFEPDDKFNSQDYTALATAPLKQEQVPKYLRKLKLI